MPQQLIYTSALRGLAPGASGYCVVAKSQGMGDLLASQLEQISYYRHLHLTNGIDRPIFCYRRLNVRGKIYHVISRLADSGYDFTKRTNFIAHHLVFDSNEILGQATPPIICRDWKKWCKSWNQEPKLFMPERWSGLAAVKSEENRYGNAPVAAWTEVSGDSGKAFGLLDVVRGGPLYLKLEESIDDNKLLTMFAESLRLLEVRDLRGFKSGAAWDYTFTTSLQAEDNPADFRWCGVRDDNPHGCQKLKSSGGIAKPLRDISSRTALTQDEKAYAKNGYQPLWVNVEGQRYGVGDFPEIQMPVDQGQSVTLNPEVGGVPSPTHTWHWCFTETQDWTTPNPPPPLKWTPDIPREDLRKRHYALRLEGSRTGDNLDVYFVVIITPRKPVIRRQPASETQTRQGARAELTVEACVEGIPDAQLTYQWYFKNAAGTPRAIPDATSSTCVITTEESHLNPASEFYVVVKNGESSVESERVKLKRNLRSQETSATQARESNRPMQYNNRESVRSTRKPVARVIFILVLLVICAVFWHKERNVLVKVRELVKEARSSITEPPGDDIKEKVDQLSALTTNLITAIDNKIKGALTTNLITAIDNKIKEDPTSAKDIKSLKTFIFSIKELEVIVGGIAKLREESPAEKKKLDAAKKKLDAAINILEEAIKKSKERKKKESTANAPPTQAAKASLKDEDTSKHPTSTNPTSTNSTSTNPTGIIWLPILRNLFFKSKRPQ